MLLCFGDSNTWGFTPQGGALCGRAALAQPAGEPVGYGARCPGATRAHPHRRASRAGALLGPQSLATGVTRKAQPDRVGLRSQRSGGGSNACRLCRRAGEISAMLARAGARLRTTAAGTDATGDTDGPLADAVWRATGGQPRIGPAVAAVYCELATRLPLLRCEFHARRGWPALARRLPCQPGNDAGRTAATLIRACC